jgi:hypothetical protein
MGTENVYLILDLLGLCLIAWMLYFTEGDTWLTREFTFGSSSAPQCNHNLCWVNPRLPSYCPECGKHIYPAVRGAIHVSDEQAELRYRCIA